jgi:hypothetical protein
MTDHISSSSTSSSTSSSSSNNGGGSMTIDIRPMIEDVSQVMTKHITNILSGVIGEYTVYKETHDTIMGLPCVRKLQQRINELEKNCPYENGRETTADESSSSSSFHGCGASREDEIKQLQSAIVELNRYIVALESKTDMKSVCSSSLPQNDEESIRLEVHEDDSSSLNNHDDESTRFFHSSNSKNVIVSSLSDQDNNNDQATETTEDLAGPDADEESEAEEEEEATEEEATDEEATEEATEEAEEEATDEATEEAEEEATEDEATEEEATEEAAEEEATEEAAEEEVAEEAEEEATEEAEEEATEEATEEEATEEEATEEAEEEEEAEIEVSEVKIKGKTYFTTDPQNGIIYACVNDDVGDEVGVFKDGVAVFNKGKK